MRIRSFAGFIVFSGLVSLSSSCGSALTPTPSPTVRLQPTSFPTRIAIPSATISPFAQACVVVSSLRVRSGPGTQYQIEDGFQRGECVSIDAKNSAATWARIANSDLWLSVAHLDITGSISQLPAKTPGRVISQQSVGNNSPTKGVQSSSPTSTAKVSDFGFIYADEASNYYGETRTVRIDYAHCDYYTDLDVTFCNDKEYPNHNFTMLRWNKNWFRYDGLCLLVTGKITPFEGKPQIIVSSISEIKIC